MIIIIFENTASHKYLV